MHSVQRSNALTTLQPSALGVIFWITFNATFAAHDVTIADKLRFCNLPGQDVITQTPIAKAYY